MRKLSILALAAATALAGCSTQAPIAGSEALPRSGSTIQHHGSRSWMLKEAASGTLVYVSEDGEYNNAGIYVYSYPDGKQVGFLQESYDEMYQGLCTDTHEHIWDVGWTSNGQAFYDEYQHGGTQLIQGLIASGNPSGCSVDPTTGNLAIANFVDYSIPGRQGDIAIWKPGSRTPALYYDNSIKHYYYCTYDTKGNLYADGDTGYINVLAKKSTTLRHVYFNKNIVPGSLQWADGSLTVTLVGGAKGPIHIDRATVQGSGAQITGTTSVETSPAWGNYLNVQYWIQGKIVAAVGPGAGGPVRSIYFWPYPGGGKASKTIAGPSYGNLYGVAISP